MTLPTPPAFAPQRDTLHCSAFSASFKLLSLVVMALAAGWAWQMAAKGALEFTLASSGWMGAALCMMLYTVWSIVRSTTTLNRQTLEQTWVWHKRVALHELAYAKLIRVPGLEWLIAPRLYTRTFSNKLAVFYATGTEMLAEFKRLEAELQASRQR